MKKIVFSIWLLMSITLQGDHIVLDHVQKADIIAKRLAMIEAHLTQNQAELHTLLSSNVPLIGTNNQKQLLTARLKMLKHTITQLKSNKSITQASLRALHNNG